VHEFSDVVLKLVPTPTPSFAIEEWQSISFQAEESELVSGLWVWPKPPERQWLPLAMIHLLATGGIRKCLSEGLFVVSLSRPW
jgi:hypothetical protein